MYFSNSIISWYNKNERELPWRDTINPYKIWLSEIILQQTRVSQGLPYYLKFIENFPTINHLASASENQVMKLWQGLGYYSRARNMHFTAKYIVQHYNSQFPENYNEILKLKGIGEYTAAAISSFCFDLPHAVVDGNVIRILSRYFGIEIPYDTSEGKKIFKNLAERELNVDLSAIHNQSIMEFGALQCVPKSPNCSVCPLSENCMAFNSNLIDFLPVKSKKISVKKRYFNYLIIENEDSTFLQKRNSGIWKSLYEFPLIEGDFTEEKLLKSDEFDEILQNSDFTIGFVSKQVKHQLTHQTIFANFWHIKVSSFQNKKYKEVNWDCFIDFPIPRLIDKYLKYIEKVTN